MRIAPLAGSTERCGAKKWGRKPKMLGWGLVGWESEPAAHPEPLLLLLAWEVHQRELKLMLRV